MKSWPSQWFWDELEKQGIPQGRSQMIKDRACVRNGVFSDCAVTEAQVVLRDIQPRVGRMDQH